MGIIRNSKEVVDQYEASPAINQSGLKVILSKGIQFFLDYKDSILRDGDKYYSEKEHFLIGKGVDCKITMGQQQYDRDYFTSRLVKKPGPAVMSILNRCYDQLIATGSDIYELGTYHALLYSSCNEEGYYMNRVNSSPQADTRVKGIMEDNIAAEYWRDLAKAKGKTVLTTTQEETVSTLFTNLTTHPHTAEQFKDREDVITVYQVPCYFTINGVPCKALIDKVDIYLRSKLIKPQDIKTTGDYTLQFHNAVRVRRYDIQGAFYTKALEENLVSLSQLTGIDLSTFRIAPFEFIVESTKFPGVPLIVPMSSDLLEIGEKGDAVFMGYTQMLDIYKFWMDMEFNIERGLADKRGILPISGDFKFNTLY